MDQKKDNQFTILLIFYSKMEKYFQSESNSKGKYKESDYTESSAGTSSKSQKKIQIKNIKKNKVIGIQDEHKYIHG